MFKTVWSTLDSWNPFMLDLNAVPLSCVWNNDFHSRLVMITLGPIGFLVLIAVVYVGRRNVFGSKGAWDAHVKKNPEANEGLWEKGEEARKKDWQSACVRVAILFLLTVFPPVSTTIFQTFGYGG